jgi:hypothetical protein
VLAHVREQRVPAGGDQAEEGRLERLAAPHAEEVGGDVPLQVIHRRERQPPRGGEGLGGGEPHQQRPHQPGSARDGHQADVIERDPGLLQRARDHEVDELQMLARGDLGNDAAKTIVHLRGDRIRAHGAPAVDDRRARIVTAGLDREDGKGGGEGAALRTAVLCARDRGTVLG